MWENGPLPSVRRDLPIYITGLEGREDIDWLLDDIAKDGDGPPAGGKRRLIRGRGSPLGSVKMLDPTTQGGGGGQLGPPSIRTLRR